MGAPFMTRTLRHERGESAPTHYYLSMGMDAVEIVLRTEELFAITIPDDEASAVRTVGDFYRLICSKLSLVPLPSPQSNFWHFTA
jgi:hypothetical protein